MGSKPVRCALCAGPHYTKECELTNAPNPRKEGK